MVKPKVSQENFRNYKYEYYVALSIIIITVLTTIYYIITNNIPLSWDPALHMLYSYIYYRLISSFNFGQIVHVSNYYPPFFSLTAAFMDIIFGFSSKIDIATNIIYYFVLVYSIYGIASTFWNKKAGYFSIILISAYPFLLVLQREFMLDFALTTMVALNVYLFLKSDYLRDFRYSLIFGIFFGLSILTKWDAPIYILPFVLSEMYFEYGFNFDRLLKETSLNMVIAAVAAFISFGWWYLPNLSIVTKRLAFFANIGGREGNPQFWTVNGWLYYIKAFDFSTGLIFFLLFLTAVVWFCWRKKLKRHEKSIILAIVVAYLILTFISNKDNRYILPVLPYSAMLTGAFLSDICETYSPKINSTFIITLVALFAVLQICSATFAVPNVHNPYIMISEKPKSENWHIKDILRTISKYSKPGDIVITLADHPYLNGQSLEFYRVIYGYNFRIFNGPYLPVDKIIKIFNKINFIIVIEPRTHKGVFAKAEESLYRAFYENKDQFKLIGKYPLPDNTTVYIYMNKKYH
jgi:4-amino-4-deoxy-L-arabinose transferase-like glycosyltransferase